ncbi:MAG TPA: IPT/TIG domain-containing protein, partial [Gaiellaceae bacterium]|nr:IPT/TIG domain-containing protein [Gaiellaceae bacterium]
DGYTVDSTTQITVGVPEDSDSPTRITVWTSDHGYAVSAKYFYVQLPPDIDHLSSSYAKANGAVQIFAGDGNFFGTTQVSFGSLKAAKFTVSADGSTITTAVPAKASAGTVDVRVTNSLSDISAVTDADQLTIVVTPKVTGFTPGAGGSGTTVTVTGSGFTGASLVKFGTVAGSNLNVTSDTSLTIQVPDGLTPGKKYKITVTNAAGTGTSIATFTAQSTGARHHTKKKS